MKLRKLVFVMGFIGIGLNLSVWAAAETEKVTEWEKISDDDGIEVFKKEILGKPIIVFKGQGMIDAPITKLIRILLDYSRATEWVDSLVAVKRLRSPLDSQFSPGSEFVDYQHIGTPFVMKDREFVLKGKISADPKAKTFSLSFQSTEDPSAPKTDYVRGEVVLSSFTLESRDLGQRTYAVTEVQADPKGSVAKWVVNKFQKDWPRNTLESLRKQVKKPDIQEDEYYKKFFTE
jgi:START domain